MHLSLAHSFVTIATVCAGWLMVRAGTAKSALRIKVEARCAACGRRRNRGGRCPCSTHG